MELAEKLGIDVPTLQENMNSLENWIATADNNFKDQETLKQPFKLSITSGKSSRESLERQDGSTFVFKPESKKLLDILKDNKAEQPGKEEQKYNSGDTKGRENPTDNFHHCCNEDHQREYPPYRTFATAREKEAHLSRTHQ